MFFFDLDGTLWDATESTAHAWTEVFQKWTLGIHVSADTIRSVAGKPYMDCLESIAPIALSLPNISDLLEDLEFSERNWMDRIGGVLYPDVLEGLKILSEYKKLYLVSNCKGWYLDAFLSQSNVADLFVKAVCHGKTGLKKSDNLIKLMQEEGVDHGFYVGDTVGDLTSAKDTGLIYVHANYGFGGSDVKTDNCHPNFSSITRYLLSIDKQE